MADGCLDDEREEELSSLSAIFPELQIDDSDPFSASVPLPVAPVKPLPVRFPTDLASPPEKAPSAGQSATANTGEAAAVQIAADKTYQLSHLPPLELRVTLPEGYPAEKPPRVKLSTTLTWLPDSALRRLEEQAQALWEEYGRCQIIYSYIDSLQQAADDGFGLHTTDEEAVPLNKELEVALLDFDRKAKQEKFERETYECGVCLEPKKGTACHQMLRCGHVFCAACLQDFYNNAIKEGDVASVRCLTPACGDKKIAGSMRVKKSSRTLGPGELLQIPIEMPTVRRYVELKRKKKLEADKTTIYCPRQWCQGPARSKKHPKVTDLSQLDSFESDTEGESSSGDDNALSPQQDRLRVCEDCNFAFCRICLAGWHGEFVRCWPRTAAELSEEEKQTYDWIRLNTSPCPTCSTPCQKTHGCNHMNCAQCRTHFCYLCSSWLDPGNPYEHFNDRSKACYQRLWELEEGDPGDGHVRFEGPRGWEAAIAAAAEAEPAEQRDNAQVDMIPVAEEQQAEDEAVVAGMANVQLDNHDPHPQAERAQPHRPAPQQAQQRRGQPNGPRDLDAGIEQVGLQRFLQMVQDDNEDEWDSDELDEDGDDADWEIPFRN
jgi:E3 ubiquitin-protein ligase RNF14